MEGSFDEKVMGGSTSLQPATGSSVERCHVPGGHLDHLNTLTGRARRHQMIILSYLPHITCDCEHNFASKINSQLKKIKKMKSIEIIMLPVKDRQKAKEFYLKLGFQVIVEAPAA